MRRLSGSPNVVYAAFLCVALAGMSAFADPSKFSDEFIKELGGEHPEMTLAPGVQDADGDGNP